MMYSRPVLIVNDDPLFTIVMATALDSLGVTSVRAARNFQDGLAVLRHADIPIGLIMVDFDLPEPEVYAFLVALPDFGFSGEVVIFGDELKGIAASARNLEKILKINVVGALKKPITVEGVAQLLERCEDPADEAGICGTEKADPMLRTA